MFPKNKKTIFITNIYNFVNVKYNKVSIIKLTYIIITWSMEHSCNFFMNKLWEDVDNDQSKNVSMKMFKVQNLAKK